MADCSTCERRPTVATAQPVAKAKTLGGNWRGRPTIYDNGSVEYPQGTPPDIAGYRRDETTRVYSILRGNRASGALWRPNILTGSSLSPAAAVVH